MVKLEQGVLSFEAENLGIKDTIRNAVSGVYEKAEKKGMEICTESFEGQIPLSQPPLDSGGH